MVIEIEQKSLKCGSFQINAGMLSGPKAFEDFNCLNIPFELTERKWVGIDVQGSRVMHIG